MRYSKQISCVIKSILLNVVNWHWNEEWHFLMLVGPLKCLKGGNNGNGTRVQTYGTCPPTYGKSCVFSIVGNQTDFDNGACFKEDLNICFLETRWSNWNKMLLPYVNCYCNSDGCNKYCTWTDCKNSTRTHFPEGVNPDRKQNVQECTAKCWPNFL